MYPVKDLLPSRSVVMDGPLSDLLSSISFLETSSRQETISHERGSNALFIHMLLVAISMLIGVRQLDRETG